MLLALILIPLLAAILILIGSPARMTALIASLMNLFIGIYAALCPL